MNDNLKKYKNELEQEISFFLKKVEKLPKDNPNKESEWEFSKETYKKLNKEINEIYTRLKNKYNIK